jgi:hypothetical protein
VLIAALPGEPGRAEMTTDQVRRHPVKEPPRGRERNKGRTQTVLDVYS